MHRRHLCSPASACVCVFVLQVERALYGWTSGAIYALLRRASLTECTLSLKRSSVPSLVSEAEYQQLVKYRIWSNRIPFVGLTGSPHKTGHTTVTKHIIHCTAKRQNEMRDSANAQETCDASPVGIPTGTGT
jgi:hypothetical protein